jgi:hypothetical protein
MKIKTEFLDVYTNKIDKLLNQSNNQKYVISSLWDYTVLSHFQCFSMGTLIVNMKVIAHDSGP